ncbi:MAG: CBS domain-containing protein [Evtepia gabavorous]
MFTKYDFAALPVVDQENRLVGIITVDDAIDVLQRRPRRSLIRWPVWLRRISPTCVRACLRPGSPGSPGCSS